MHEDIKMYRLKTLKEDIIPENWIVFYWDGKRVEWCEATYLNKELTFTNSQVSDANCILDMFNKQTPRKKIWMIGSMMYDMLCWQGLYNQLDNDDISFPKKENKEGVEVLCQALVTNEPTIIDLIVSSKEQKFHEVKVHCMDFLNWGITKTQSLNDACMKLQQYISMVVELKMGSLQDTAAGQGYTRFRRYDLGE